MAPDPNAEYQWIQRLSPAAGRKDDQGKLQWHLLPLAEVEEVVKVLMHGSRKYGEDNWKHVFDGSNRYYNAAMRHIVAHLKGDRRDEESGLPHLAHAIASLLFIMHLENRDE